MNETLEKLQEMQDEVDTAKIENASNEGIIKEKLASANDAFDVDTPKSINKKLKEMRGTLLTNKKSIEEKAGKLFAEYGEENE